MTTGSRIAALNRSITRRIKLDERLRQQLMTERDEYTALDGQCAAQRAHVQAGQDVLTTSVQKVDSMIDGIDAFTLGDLNSQHLYVAAATEQLNEERVKLNQLESSLSGAADLIAQTQREITQNSGRIDRCRERLRIIQRELEVAADNVIDEEAEELAAARLLRAKAAR